MAWIGGRPEAPPQPTIEQMMRGGPEKVVAVSADILRAQPTACGWRMEALAAPWRHPAWVADSSEEEDDWEAYVREA